MTQTYNDVCKLIESLQFEELRVLIPFIETKIEQLENKKWRASFTENNKFEQLENKKWRATFTENNEFPINVTNFKSNYDTITNQLDGLSVEFPLDIDDERFDVELEITFKSVAVSLFSEDASPFTFIWEVYGSPEKFATCDPSYNADPESQVQIPSQVLKYMLFLWRGFLSATNSKN